MAIKGSINPQQGSVGRVVVSTTNQTTISSPNFVPKVNVALSDIQDLDVSVKTEGDVLAYNSSTGKFETTQITSVAVTVTNIDEGYF